MTLPLFAALSRCDADIDIVFRFIFLRGPYTCHHFELPDNRRTGQSVPIPTDYSWRSCSACITPRIWQGTTWLWSILTYISSSHFMFDWLWWGMQDKRSLSFGWHIWLFAFNLVIRLCTTSLHGDDDNLAMKLVQSMYSITLIQALKICPLPPSALLFWNIPACRTNSVLRPHDQFHATMWPLTRKAQKNKLSSWEISNGCWLIPHIPTMTGGWWHLPSPHLQLKSTTISRDLHWREASFKLDDRPWFGTERASSSISPLVYWWLMERGGHYHLTVVAQLHCPGGLVTVLKGFCDKMWRTHWQQFFGEDTVIVARGLPNSKAMASLLFLCKIYSSITCWWELSSTEAVYGHPNNYRTMM